VLLSHDVVLLVLNIFPLSFLIFGLNLAIELLSNESFTLLISHNGLLLLFVVEHGIELLNGSPLIVLVDLREHLGWRLFRADERSGVPSGGLSS
jgi:hypothetical protein